MSKNASLLSLGCLIVGLVLGAGGTYVVVMPHYAKLAARTLFVSEQIKLGEASARSADAYKHESKPVAIYALSQYLIVLKKAEEIPENSYFMPRRLICFDMMLAHARLAKLYTETGQAEVGAQHVAEALRCARETGICLTITNETTLIELVARLDRKATQ